VVHILPRQRRLLHYLGTRAERNRVIGCDATRSRISDSGVEMRRAVVTVLAEMTALDVQNLAAIEQASPSDLRKGSVDVWTGKLPEKAVPVSRRERGVYDKLPSLEVLTSLSNLERLGCVYSGNELGRVRGVSPVQIVGLTPFGWAFVQACTHSARSNPGRT